jgi:glycosyltransferase involved in cell wall biosynthesis
VAVVDVDADETSGLLTDLALQCAEADAELVIVVHESDGVWSAAARWPTATLLVEPDSRSTLELRSAGLAGATGDLVFITVDLSRDAERLTDTLAAHGAGRSAPDQPTELADLPRPASSLSLPMPSAVIDGYVGPLAMAPGALAVRQVARARAVAPLRICMVTTFYPPFNFGGDGIAIQRLSRALARHGHDVTVVHDGDAYVALSGKEPSAATHEDGVNVVTLRSAFGRVSPFLTQQFGHPVVHGRRLEQILARGADVTFFHNISLVGGPAILSHGRGITLYEAHEHWLVCPTHVLWRHDRERCDGRECFRCVVAHRRPPQLWRWTGHLERNLGHVDAFIAKSHFSREKHREFGFAAPMEVIPYFLPDADAAAPNVEAAAPRLHDRPYFLFVGRLERIKGLDDVIPTFLSGDGPDLLIAGDGEHGPVLRALAGDSPRVRFLGRVPPDELARYYADAVALIVPSVCYETFGIILIEAFRQGTPVIARRLGPLPEIVEAAGGGLLFDSPAELDEAMRRIVDEPGLRARFAESAQRAFSDRWSESVVLPQYLRLIRRIAMETGNHAVVDALSREEWE